MAWNVRAEDARAGDLFCDPLPQLLPGGPDRGGARRYVEDLSLWGVNSYLVWFGMEEFNGIKDPNAQAMLALCGHC